jgi:3-methyladenine DNA glycosylase AlkD
MDSQTSEKLQELKRDFHAMMNGPVSASLREKGLHYRVIYGVEWNRLVELAQEIGKDQDLAQALWKEDIRECRLLAGLLQPAETFLPEVADIWVESMHYPEEAQYTVLSLFQHLKYASDKAFCWIADNREIFQLCGWLLLSRLFMRGAPLNQRSEDEFVDQAEAALA